MGWAISRGGSKLKEVALNGVRSRVKQTNKKKEKLGSCSD